MLCQLVYNTSTYVSHDYLSLSFCYLGMNNSRMSIPAAREINQEICHLPGFIVLQWLIPKHSHIPKIYLLLIALLLGQPVKQLPQHLQVCFY